MHEHIKSAHEDIKLNLFRGEQTTLTEVSQAEAKRVTDMRMRKDPNFLQWTSEALGLLTPGKLVWAR